MMIKIRIYEPIFAFYWC